MSTQIIPWVQSTDTEDHAVYPIYIISTTLPALRRAFAVLLAQERDSFARGLDTLKSHPASHNHRADIRRRIMDNGKENSVEEMFTCHPSQGVVHQS